jgi:hypothetical protein
MHDEQSINPGAQIVHHNARAFGQPLQSPDWERFPDIEDTEEYKAGEKSFPSERDGNERDQLAGDFIDDYELGIFRGGGAGGAGGGGDSDEGDGGGGENR